MSESTPSLIDTFLKLEEQIVKTMNAEYLEGDLDPETLSDEDREEQLKLLQDRQESIYNQLCQKADTTWQWQLHTKAKIAALGEEIKALQKTKKSYENSIKGLMNFIAYKMERSKIEEIPGASRKMVLEDTESLVVKDIDLTSDHYLDLNEEDQEPLVKRVYSWDKNAVKRAYKINPEAYGKFIEKKSGKKVVFKKT
jgi:hypothetical protein